MDKLQRVKVERIVLVYPGETLVKRKKPKYLTPAKIRKLQRLQRKAYTFTEIAEMTGIDRQEVINVLYPTT